MLASAMVATMVSANARPFIVSLRCPVAGDRCQRESRSLSVRESRMPAGIFETAASGFCAGRATSG
jgi:hypothetical protein